MWPIVVLQLCCLFSTLLPLKFANIQQYIYYMIELNSSVFITMLTQRRKLEILKCT